jgi:hypothetical protein
MHIQGSRGSAHKTDCLRDGSSLFLYIIKDQGYMMETAVTSFVDKEVRWTLNVVPFRRVIVGLQLLEKE